MQLVREQTKVVIHFLERTLHQALDCMSLCNVAW